jgi:RimJ/RimL family protein N-acetyltransferase
MICLATPRLLVRSWREEDFEPYAAILADPEVMRHIGDGSIGSLDEARESFRRITSDWDRTGRGLFALERLDNGVFIGLCGLSEPRFLPEILPADELGWRLRSDQWGNGFATEAAGAVADWGFATFDLERIVSIIALDNARSIRVATKLGMRRERRTIVPRTGRWVEVYELTADAWRDGAD